MMKKQTDLSDRDRRAGPAGHRPAFPLSMVRAGEQVRVQAVSGKDETRHFLHNLGFVDEAVLTVVAEVKGNMIVKIKGTKVAVSKTLARRIMTN
ncbi:FeoA family protein [Sporolactobacillus sp. KGMB 08714]|uniref:FeoA family protein n=1 Tax=Sporolactobacillus sp. KGMB 08714 TaxID=3064704 RepID=UPI002FBE69E0